MAATPAPPFRLEYSAQAREDVTHRPELEAQSGQVLQRAASDVRLRLDRGENLALDVYGRPEGMVLRISLVPPELVRIEGVECGGPAPEGALAV